MRLRRNSSVKLDEIEKNYQEAKRIADAREPRIHALVSWMLARRVSNGIGEDFEWTLDSPRRLGG